MPPFDQIAWLPICIGLTGLGAVATVYAFRRKDSQTGQRSSALGFRLLGWTLLPMAIYLTGLARLLYTVVAETIRWATRLVISPSVWVGVALFFVSFVLLGGAGLVRRRRRRARSEEGRAAAGAGRTQPAGAPADQKGGTGTKPEQQPKAVGKGKKEENPLEGFEEIDEILKRRGIS